MNRVGLAFGAYRGIVERTMTKKLKIKKNAASKKVNRLAFQVSFHPAGDDASGTAAVGKRNGGRDGSRYSRDTLTFITQERAASRACSCVQ